MHKPLTGVKVVEMSTFVAGPVTARLLADLGAEVIKVERPEGDAWRITGVSYLPGRFSKEENPVFDIYNTGKKHLALNLKTPEGMEVFHKLLAEADVFITNTRPRALKRLGLAYEDLKDRYPGLIYGILLGYGEQGPESEKPAFDTSAFWAKSGFLRDLSLKREDYAPVQPPYGVGDTVTGYLLMAEICAALYRKKETGLGDYVRAGLYHNSIFSMGTMAIITQKPFGWRYPMERPSWPVPSGEYQCADGEWIYISGYTDAIYPRIYRILGREDLASDPRFTTAAGRWENRYAYYEEIRKAFLTRPSAEWLCMAEEQDLPMIRMGHFGDISTDEQAWVNGYLEHVDFPNGHTDVMPSSPIEMDSVGELKTVPAPGVGAHSAEILKSLGYTDAQLEKMEKAGAIVIGTERE